MLTDNLIYKKAFNFSIRIIKVYKMLVIKNEYILSKQLLRCSTSIGANVKEAIVAQSKRDFLTKIYIALKEASETEYWLDLLKESGYIEKNIYYQIREECREINKILCATAKTTTQNISKNKK